MLLRLRSKRAVSTIVATIIMVNIAVVLGVTAYLYQQNMLGTMIANYGLYVDRNKAMMRERINIVNIRFDDTVAEYNLNLTVLNSGSKEVWIAAIYLNDTNIMDALHEDPSNPWNNAGDPPQTNAKDEYLLVIGESLTFSFENSLITPLFPEPIADGSLQSFTVVAADGVKAQEEWLAPMGV